MKQPMRCLSGFLCACLLPIADVGLADTLSPLHIEDLRCEDNHEPLGVESAHPVLSWRIGSEVRGARQTAYQVLAGRYAAFEDEGDPLVWDSGKVVTADPRASYAGESLVSAQRVFWKVRIWDQDGRMSAWSPISQWRMGLLDADAWRSKWIAGPESPPVFSGAQWVWSADCDGLDAPPGTRYFRRTFKIGPDSVIQSARLRVLADNEFAVCVNGRRAGSEKGWMVLGDYDITERITPGVNVVAIEATNGGEGNNPAGLLARIDIEYGTGRWETVMSDSDWRASVSAEPGWRQPEFDDTAWPGANALGAYGMEPWGKTATPQARALPIFRKEFTVEKPVARAVAYVCGLGHFEMSLNGAKVGDHVFDPGWSDYRDTCFYVPFELTERLRDGVNAVGFMLGNGMYNVPGGRYVKFTGSFGEPKLIAQILIEYSDESSEWLVSDDSWRTSPGPITFSCIYGGEDYDARLDQNGWNAPGFDDTRWAPARLVDGPGGALRVSEAAPIKVFDILRPVRVEKRDNGEYFADLGLNLSARPFVKMRGAKGSRVTVRVGELRDRPWEGHSYTFTLRGEGEEFFRPYFTYFGFQHLFINGADIEADAAGARPLVLDMGAEFVTSASRDVGSFHCDVELFNEIDAMIDRSVRSNLQSVLTDCPHREKLGWLEVSHLMGPSIFYHYDAAGLYRKICRDTTEAQLENGMVPDIAPEYTRFSEGFFESAEWGSACVQIPWLLYRWYGDEAILTRQFDTMARYTRYLASTRDGNGLAKGGLGDWYDWTPEKGHAGYSQLTPLELTATAFLHDNARIVAETARLIGRADDAQAFGDLAARVREDFIEAYYNAEEHTIAAGSQAALSVGLHFGLAPEEDRVAVLNALVNAIESMEYKPTTGEVCFPFLVRSLAEAGRSDLVYRIIDRTDAPGYGCMLRQFGLKTLSEQWDKPGSSLNHCMFGHIQEWFQGYILGIRQAEGSTGFARVQIAPTPIGDLHEASGHYDSPRGRIDVAWKKTASTFTLDVTVPGNTTAAIVLPVAPGAEVFESGAPAQNAPGVIKVEHGKSGTTVNVGSGSYRFACTENPSDTMR